MHLIDASGRRITYYYEPLEPDRWNVTASDAVQYEMRRR
jgi:hypothetical protein